MIERIAEMKKRILVLAVALVLATGCAQKGMTEEEKQALESEISELKEDVAHAEQSASEAEMIASDANEKAEQSAQQAAPVQEIKVSENVVTDKDFDQMAPPAQGEQIAILKTSMGEMKVRLFPEDAPKAVENFVKHAQEGYYDGLTFNRVVQDFMIQGGDPTETGRGGESIWGTPFEDEFSARLHNYRGALSMANAGPNTNGSQFFVVTKGPDESFKEFLQELSNYTGPIYQDNRSGEIISGAQRFTEKAVENYTKIGGTPFLDGGFPQQDGVLKGHAVFGQVYEGMDVADNISMVAVGDDGETPVEPVVIETIEITTAQ